MAVGHIRKNQVKTPLMKRHQTRLEGKGMETVILRGLRFLLF